MAIFTCLSSHIILQNTYVFPDLQVFKFANSPIGFPDVITVFA